MRYGEVFGVGKVLYNFMDLVVSPNIILVAEDNDIPLAFLGAIEKIPSVACICPVFLYLYFIFDPLFESFNYIQGAVGRYVVADNYFGWRY